MLGTRVSDGQKFCPPFQQHPSHIKKVTALIADILGVNQHDLFWWQDFRFENGVDEIALAVDHHHRSIATRDAFEIFRDEVLQSLGFAVA